MTSLFVRPVSTIVLSKFFLNFENRAYLSVLRAFNGPGLSFRIKRERSVESWSRPSVAAALVGGGLFICGLANGALGQPAAGDEQPAAVPPPTCSTEKI